MEQIYLTHQGQNIPAKLASHTRGQQSFVAILRQDQKGTPLILAGPSATLVITLRLLARQIEAAATQQGILSVPDAAEPSSQAFSLIKMSDLNGEPSHDWPLIAQRFSHTLPWLVEVILSDPTTARYLKKWRPGEELAEVAPPPHQLTLDLATVQPHLAKIMASGKPNKSEIARVLNIKPGGATNWPRVQAVAATLEDKPLAVPFGDKPLAIPPGDKPVSIPDAEEKAA